MSTAPSQSPTPPLVVAFPSERLAPALSLPLPLTSLIGREREVSTVYGLLRQAEVRLLTLTGPGGVGKTRLAIEVASMLAHDFADGVAFVPLAPVSSVTLVSVAIARAVGIRDAGSRPLRDRLQEELRDRHVLLVLDNFEHVVDAAATVADLLTASLRLKVLITSRERLHVRGERRISVSPLQLPNTTDLVALDDLARVAAVALFVARASEAAPSFALTHENATAVTAICRRLDGLPLAIELAAARTELLSPASILSRLESSLPLLTDGPRDAPPRQRTMRDAIRWSYDLLQGEEQALFRRLAVFAGGFTLDAAEDIGQNDSALTLLPSTLDLVASLVDHSLLRREGGFNGEPRFGMMETVREFALDLLSERGEDVAARHRHLTWCLTLAEQAAPRLLGPDQAQWFARLEAEYGNLSAALAWVTADAAGDEIAHLGLRLAGALWWFWYHRGLLGEGRRWLAQVLAKRSTAPGADRAQALLGAGFLALYQGDQSSAAMHLDQALALYQELGDGPGIALTLFALGVRSEDHGDYDRATVLFAEALPRFVEQEVNTFVALTQYHLGVVAYGQGDLERAAALLAEAHQLASAAGEPFATAGALSFLGLVRCDRGDHAGAFAALRECLATDWAIGQHEGIARGLANLATLAQARGEPVVAVRVFAAVHTLTSAIDYVFGLPELARYERAEHEAKVAIGEAAFSRAQAAGRSLSLEQVIAEATAEPGEGWNRSDQTGPDNSTTRHGLTPREREVLQLLADGLADRQIAAKLSISPHTVMRHVQHILVKLDVESRTAAATQALRLGLISSRPVP